VAEFVVGGVVGDEEALLVAGSGASDDAGAPDGGLDHRDEGAKFALEDRVEVVGAPRCDQAVAVCKLGEDANVVRVLVLHSVRHQLLYQSCTPLIKELKKLRVVRSFLLPHLHHQIRQAIHKTVALALGYPETLKHSLPPRLDIQHQHFVLGVALQQLLSFREQQLVFILFEALVVVGWQRLELALLRERLVLAESDVLEASFDVPELSFQGVDALEGVVVELVVFLHALEDLVRLGDVGVGPDVVVGLVGLLVALDQPVVFHLYDLLQHAVSVQHLQNPFQFLPLDQGGPQLVDLSLLPVLLDLQLPNELPFAHIPLHQSDELVLVSHLSLGDVLGLTSIPLQLPV
jgi:hypothetical protein